MNRVLILAALLFAMLSLTFGQNKNKMSGPDYNVKKELRNLVRAWDEATVKGDAATLDGLLAVEFAFVGGENKSRYLEFIKSKSSDSIVESAVSDDLQIEVYGDAAIVTGLDTIKGSTKGRAYVQRWLFMDVWVKRAGRWQCVKTYSNLAEKL